MRAMCQATKREMSEWVTHGMMRAMCQATKRKISESGGRESVEEKKGRNKVRKKERKKGRDKRNRKKEGKGERMRESTTSSSDLRRSDGRSSSG